MARPCAAPAAQRSSLAKGRIDPASPRVQAVGGAELSIPSTATIDRRPPRSSVPVSRSDQLRHPDRRSPPTSTSVPDGTPPIAVEEELTRLTRTRQCERRVHRRNERLVQHRLRGHRANEVTVDIPIFPASRGCPDHRSSRRPASRGIPIQDLSSHRGSGEDHLYVMADDCVQRGTSRNGIVDHGQVDPLQRLNPTNGELVIIATFPLEATADGPLTITEGIAGRRLRLRFAAGLRRVSESETRGVGGMAAAHSISRRSRHDSRAAAWGIGRLSGGVGPHADHRRAAV